MKHRLERETASETEGAKDGEDGERRADDLETADSQSGSVTEDGQKSGPTDETETLEDEAERDERDGS